MRGERTVTSIREGGEKGGGQKNIQKEAQGSPHKIRGSNLQKGGKERKIGSGRILEGGERRRGWPVPRNRKNGLEGGIIC